MRDLFKDSISNNEDNLSNRTTIEVYQPDLLFDEFIFGPDNSEELFKPILLSNEHMEQFHLNLVGFRFLKHRNFTRKVLAMPQLTLS